MIDHLSNPCRKGEQMGKIRRYTIEGTILEIPIYWEERSQRYLEDYSCLLEHPVHTKDGYPIFLTIEDACPDAEMQDVDPSSIDCGSCRYYRQTPGTLLGVCRNEKRRWDADIRKSDERKEEIIE